MYLCVAGVHQGHGRPASAATCIPDLMKEALAVSFDTHVGHDFFEDADARYDFYHRPESRIPFDLELLNNDDRRVASPARR
jgi:hypothetical protein